MFRRGKKTAKYKFKIADKYFKYYKPEKNCNILGFFFCPAAKVIQLRIVGRWLESDFTGKPSDESGLSGQRFPVGHYSDTASLTRSDF